MTLEREIDSRDKTILMLVNKVETLEEEKRKHNLVIEGLPEERIGHIRKSLDDLFKFIEVNFNSGWTQHTELVS